MEVETVYEFTYQNTCTCCEDEDYIMFEALQIDCDGECWERVLEDFKDLSSVLFDKNETMWWKVSNMKLWDGNHSGYGYANTSEKLLQLMGVNADWTMYGKVFDDRIEYSLSHHDAPMGSNSVLTMISDQQREDLGLY